MKDLRHRAQLFEEVCERNREHRLQIFRTETEQMKKIIQMKVADGKAQQELAQTYREEQEALRENITALRARMDGRIQHSGDHETEQSPGDSFCERDQLSSEIAEAETQLEVRLHDYLQKSALYRERSAEFSSELARVKRSILQLQTTSRVGKAELNSRSEDIIRENQKNEKIMDALEKERDEYKAELFHVKKKLELQSESETENETETANTPDSTPDTTPDDFVALTPDMIHHQSAYEILWTCYPSETEQQRAVEELNWIFLPLLVFVLVCVIFVGLNEALEKVLLGIIMIHFNLLDYKGWSIMFCFTVFAVMSSIDNFIDRLRFFEEEYGTEYAVGVGIFLSSLGNLVRFIIVVLIQLLL